MKAFVAYSGGWWDAPTDRLKGVPALIMCGEEDERYQATYEFFQKGLAWACHGFGEAIPILSIK